jgi:hypothetical protein
MGHPALTNASLYLAALWAVLLLLLLLIRKPGGLRTTIVAISPVLFVLAAVAAVILNQILYADEGLSPLHYIVAGLAWPAICLWTLAAAVGWNPIFRTAPCLLVTTAFAAYWYLKVFPLEGLQATHPMTFVSSVPFFLTLLFPVVMWGWSFRPERKAKPAKKVPAKAENAAKTKQATAK